MQIKSDLRKELLVRRKNQDKEKKADAEKKIFDSLISLPEYIKAPLVLCYVSLPDEISTFEIINHCFEIKKPIAVPICCGEKMSFRLISSISDLEKGTFSVLEPKSYCPKAEIISDSICITPALCYNDDGFRIGYGKGFYDRFFADNPCIKVGLCVNENIIDFKPDSNDIGADIIITDKKVKKIDFSTGKDKYE